METLKSKVQALMAEGKKLAEISSLLIKEGEDVLKHKRKISVYMAQIKKQSTVVHSGG